MSSFHSNCFYLLALYLFGRKEYPQNVNLMNREITVPPGNMKKAGGPVYPHKNI